jgi:protein phosphatase
MSESCRSPGHAEVEGTVSILTPLDLAAATRDCEQRARAATVERGVFTTTCGELDLAAASYRGTRHVMNEDAHSALDGLAPVYIVADGVGGGAMAWRASRQLVRHLHRALDRRHICDEVLRDALLDADREVARSIASYTEQLGAATVALCVRAGAGLSTWLVAWVGDCRAYRIAAGIDDGAELLTRDDTYRHLGETPPAGVSLDDPARMVGNGAVSIPNVARVELRDDEMLMLCSDGVHKHVHGADIARVLRRRRTSLARRCVRLLALARARGSSDDATVLVVHRAAPVRRCSRPEPSTQADR